jgi:hypothetical protein
MTGGYGGEMKLYMFGKGFTTMEVIVLKVQVVLKNRACLERNKELYIHIYLYLLL